MSSEILRSQKYSDFSVRFALPEHQEKGTVVLGEAYFEPPLSISEAYLNGEEMSWGVGLESIMQTEEGSAFFLLIDEKKVFEKPFNHARVREYLQRLVDIAEMFGRPELFADERYRKKLVQREFDEDTAWDSINEKGK